MPCSLHVPQTQTTYASINTHTHQGQASCEMPPCMPTPTSEAAKRVPSHLPPFTSSTSRMQGKGSCSSWVGFLPGGGCSAEPSVAERVLSGLLTQSGAAQESQMPAAHCPGVSGVCCNHSCRSWSDFNITIKVVDGSLQLKNPQPVSLLLAQRLLCTKLLPQAPTGFAGMRGTGTASPGMQQPASSPRASPDPASSLHGAFQEEGERVVVQHPLSSSNKSCLHAPNRNPGCWRAQHRPGSAPEPQPAPRWWMLLLPTPLPTGRGSRGPTHCLPPSSLVVTHPSKMMFTINSQPPAKNI